MTHSFFFDLLVARLREGGWPVAVAAIAAVAMVVLLIWLPGIP